MPSLVGVVVTSAGVLLGADTFSHDSLGRVTEQVQKICIAGPRAAAGMAGLAGVGSVDATGAFLSKCTQISTDGHLSLDERANALVATVANAIALGLREGPLDPTLLRESITQVIVVGYEGGPKVILTELGLERSGAGLQLRAKKLDSVYCVLGIGTGTKALDGMAEGKVVPAAFGSTFGAALNGQQPCRISRTEGRRLLFAAVEGAAVTPSEYGVKPRTVDWPVDVVFLRPGGSPTITRFTRSQALVTLRSDGALSKPSARPSMKPTRATSPAEPGRARTPPAPPRGTPRARRAPIASR